MNKAKLTGIKIL